MGRKYKNDDIITLSARDFTRKRPSTYLGSNEYSTQLLREIFANSLDEHCAGHGQNIKVTYSSRIHECSVEDDGQGFPINVAKEDKTVLEAAFSVINTSGKYDDTKDGAYGGSSLGANGVGAKLTTFLSEWLTVDTYSGKAYESLVFKDGIFDSRSIGKSDHKSGTIVKWKPDAQFFQSAGIELAAVRKLFKDISALCPKLKITFEVDGNIEIYESKEGLQSLLDDVVGQSEILKNRFIACKNYEDGMLDIAMTYNADYSDNVRAYVNYGLTESGVHVSIVKALLTRHINRFALDNKLIKKESDTFSPSELCEGLVLVFNVKCTNVKYDSQTKLRVVDLNKQILNDAINSEFPNWLNNNPKDAKLIIERAMTARKAKDAAQAARDRIRGVATKGKKFISLPTKLTDSYSKDRSECELLVCEGDSAAAGLIAKRDGKTQAVFPIRGKILSCRKASPDKVYANAEIANIVKALGLEVDKATGKLIYDIKKLRYGKIIIASDGDPDGAQIAMLLVNVFWWLCPELVINGHIYKAMPPLFRITTKKNEYIFLKDATELEEYKNKHKNESFMINRNKGLGEQDPDELAQCLLRPETRNVQQLSVQDAKSTDDILELFMGPEVEPRRKYLLENSLQLS